MAILIKKPKKAKYISMLRLLAAAALLMCPLAAMSDGFFNDYYSGGMYRTMHTETPVASYYAYPQDINFVPESEFMQRTDGLDYDNNIMMARDAEYAAHPGVAFAEKPAVICRNFGCTRLNDKITRPFLFNSIANLFMMNAHSRMYICEADPFSRSCLQSGISFPARVGAANALVKISKAAITQVDVSPGLSRSTVGITYEMLVNGNDRRCNSTYMDINVPANSNATLATREFPCNMTSDGATNISILVNIDYIDLDYGIMGGYYSLGMQGPSSGGSTGYALFKTEYTSNSIQMQAAGSGTVRNTSGIIQSQSIRPGEYTVGPVGRR